MEYHLSELAERPKIMLCCQKLGFCISVASWKGKKCHALRRSPIRIQYTTESPLSWFFTRASTALRSLGRGGSASTAAAADAVAILFGANLFDRGRFWLALATLAALEGLACLGIALEIIKGSLRVNVNIHVSWLLVHFIWESETETRCSMASKVDRDRVRHVT